MWNFCSSLSSHVSDFQASFFAVSTVLELISRTRKLHVLVQYVIEFVLIILPCLFAVCFPNSIARLLTFLVLIGFVCVALAAWYRDFFGKEKERERSALIISNRQGLPMLTMKTISEQRRALDGV